MNKEFFAPQRCFSPGERNSRTSASSTSFPAVPKGSQRPLPFFQRPLDVCSHCAIFDNHPRNRDTKNWANFVPNFRSVAKTTDVAENLYRTPHKTQKCVGFLSSQRQLFLIVWSPVIPFTGRKTLSDGKTSIERHFQEGSSGEFVAKIPRLNLSVFWSTSTEPDTDFNCRLA